MTEPVNAPNLFGIAAAAAAMGDVVQAEPTGDEQIAADASASEEAEVVDGNSPPDQPETEEASSDAEAPEATETETPEAAPAGNERLGRIAKRLRDDRRTVTRELAEVRQLKQELESLRNSANPWQEVSELSKRDPIAGLERFAEMNGTTTSAVLERYARHAIGKPEEPQDAVAAMRTELEQFKSQLKQRDEQELARQQQIQLQQSIESGVEELMVIQQPEHASKYPFASALDPEDLRNECRAAINFLISKNMALPADQIADVINKKIERLVRPVLAKNQPGNGKTGGSNQPGNGAKGSAGVSAPVGGAIRSSRRDTLTNRDAAGVVASKPMTAEDRLKMAAEEIGKGISFDS
jgi:hypothetical protein